MCIASFQPILKVTLAWAGKGRIFSGFHFKTYMTPDSIFYFRAGADPSGKDRDVMKAVEKARAAVWSLSDLGMTGATTPEIGCRS